MDCVNRCAPSFGRLQSVVAKRAALWYVAARMANKNKRRKKAWLLGLGLDNEDGHTRITAGENFKLVGGSEETHKTMQEKAIKMNEHLKQRGKTLEQVTSEEFHEIADKVGMPLLEARRVRLKN